MARDSLSIGPLAYRWDYALCLLSIPRDLGHFKAVPEVALLALGNNELPGNLRVQGHLRVLSRVQNELFRARSGHAE